MSAWGGRGEGLLVSLKVCRSSTVPLRRDLEKMCPAISGALLTGEVLLCASGLDYQHVALHLSV